MLRLPAAMQSRIHAMNKAKRRDAGLAGGLMAAPPNARLCDCDEIQVRG
jgi:hypothetical protein